MKETSKNNNFEDHILNLMNDQNELQLEMNRFLYENLTKKVKKNDGNFYLFYVESVQNMDILALVEEKQEISDLIEVKALFRIDARSLNYRFKTF